LKLPVRPPHSFSEDAKSRARLQAHFEASRTAIEAAQADSEFMDTLFRIGLRWADAIRNGGKILLAGNGGSAADAQHIAGELVVRLNFDRPAIAAIALTTDSSVMTAIGNDFGYEHVFARQVAALARPGDIFVGISTSGNSRNILLALDAAHAASAMTVGFTGQSGGAMKPRCDICLCAPSPSTPLVQQIHMAAAHAVCETVEHTLFGREGR